MSRSLSRCLSRSLSLNAPDPRQPPHYLDRPRPFVIAHRGASNDAPENTLAAFRLALEQGADVIETDLWFTADSELVCHHDHTAQRMAGDPRRVDGLTLAELRELVIRGPLAVRFPNEHIPTLREVQELVPVDVPLVLELKDPRFADPDWAARLVAQIRERIARQTVVVIAFDLAWVKCVKSIEPRVHTGHISLFNPLPAGPTQLVGPYWRLLQVNPWYVRLAHRWGKWVCPLDPDLHRHLSRYLALDVDAVLTNEPEVTRARLAQLQGQSR